VDGCPWNSPEVAADVVAIDSDLRRLRPNIIIDGVEG